MHFLVAMIFCYIVSLSLLQQVRLVNHTLYAFWKNALTVCMSMIIVFVTSRVDIIVRTTLDAFYGIVYVLFFFFFFSYEKLYYYCVICTTCNSSVYWLFKTKYYSIYYFRYLSVSRYYKRDRRCRS